MTVGMFRRQGEDRVTADRAQGDQVVIHLPRIRADTQAGAPQPDPTTLGRCGRWAKEFLPPSSTRMAPTWTSRVHSTLTDFLLFGDEDVPFPLMIATFCPEGMETAKTEKMIVTSLKELREAAKKMLNGGLVNRSPLNQHPARTRSRGPPSPRHLM